VFHPLSLLKLLLGSLWFAILVAIFFPLCLLLLPSRRLRIGLCNVFGKLAGRGCIWLSGAQVPAAIAQRTAALHPAIYVSNHTSLFDMFIAIWACPLFTCGTAKKEIIFYPFLGLLYIVSGHLRVDRGNRQKAQHEMEKIGALVRRYKLGLWIWPEGTRSRDGRLLPLKKGFAHMALATRLPIVPVVVRGAHKVWEKNTLAVRKASGVLSVEVLDPIPTVDWTLETLDQHIAAVYRAFADALPPDQQPLPALGAGR
jgi:1-acyl-sn-glycerol-3-phosphate acyltransferase